MKITESQDDVMKVVLPENLDLSSLVSKHKPNFCFKVDRCKYILSQVAEQFTYNRQLTDTNDCCPYVPLSAAILVRQVHDYQSYLRYLVEVGVLECDGWYEVGRKCKGYRYTKAYRTKSVTSQITNSGLVKNNLKRVYEINKAAFETYPNLIHWLNGLKLDEKAAIALIDEDYAKSYSSDNTQVRNRAFIRYMGRLGMVNRFVHNPPTYRIDGKAHRFHTKLTNFWSKLRPLLTFKGIPLVSVDLSCSQPYLATVLLQSFFYQNNADGKISISQLAPDVQGHLLCTPTVLIETRNEMIYPSSYGSAKPYELAVSDGSSCSLDLVKAGSNYPSPHTLSLPPSLHPSPTPPTPHHSPSLMLGLLSSNRAIEDEFELFKTSVEKGQLYEMLGECIRLKTGKVITNRQQLKDMMFSVFFSDNNTTEAFIKRACEVFRQTFPLIYSVFRELKARSNSDLAILLQALEAEIFLNRIAHRISQEKPDLPIFTMHDSIIVIEGYEDYVEGVMRDELYEATGIVPHFKKEKWAS